MVLKLALLGVKLKLFGLKIALRGLKLALSYQFKYPDKSNRSAVYINFDIRFPYAHQTFLSKSKIGMDFFKRKSFNNF